ncbi:hypothetical protein [Paraburkholderia aspalathi]|uniref:hypothetical protein n=1 Tax=Paraburkholderia aspalathi TaxID=1324617 RepID=UPI000B855860|nr:hypothetical protein [Paraburkholderia aspalathi]
MRMTKRIAEECDIHFLRTKSGLQCLDDHYHFFQIFRADIDRQTMKFACLLLRGKEAIALEVLPFRLNVTMLASSSATKWLSTALSIDRRISCRE